MAEACITDQKVSANLDFSAKNHEGNTILILCIQHMDGKLFDQLVNHQSSKVSESINEVNSDGNTALHVATTLGKWSIVQRLLENESISGVDVHKANKAGLTCLVLTLLAR